ncbi:MAG: alpha-1,4-glucan--maltose-1-phosphate maltosyltransferase [Rhodospirillales bacterium]|nr:alpha-1,4-glucan--maltose-1-phosphate maltosyltransferase [Rhodospirillales bacterium]
MNSVSTEERTGVGARPASLAAGLKSRSIVIEKVEPQIDGGRWPVKREVGDDLNVSARVFRDGHVKLAAVILWRRADETTWREMPMTLVNPGLDLWEGSIRLTANTTYVYTVEAWTDHYETWAEELEKKLGADQVVALELLEGRALVTETAARASGDDAEMLESLLIAFDKADDERRPRLMLADHVRAAMQRWPDRKQAIRYDRELEVFVDRIEARFAAWYEMFHRSQGTVPGKSATFADCEERLPEIKEMGFDVIYFVPIHPIGRLHRKGPDNTLNAGPDDPGSPYAIGSDEGGHKAVHPDLGTLSDFRRFVRACHAQGMEVALDFAIQCAPDHPWIKEHPEWFIFRPDGTIKYAENPPKKYQDIVNVNFYGPHQEALWNELLSTFLFWVEQGVKIFRVDNPHTKPVPFWEWVIREVHAVDPEVIFLAEAFTRPPMMQMLGKVGYTQSYTYFTWRNFKSEIIEYLTELTTSPVKDFMRPNFFPSTPDINPPYLQTGGRPAHMVRFALASTLSTVYGIYNGFELCEATPIPGKEEFLHSEKYDYKVWDWDRPGNIKAFITRINHIRRENPALHELDNLRFYPADDDNILFYGKMTPDGSNIVFVVVNLDPFDSHVAELELPLEAMGLKTGDTFQVEELLTGRKHLWRSAKQGVKLDPEVNPVEIYRIGSWEKVDYRSPCY